MDLVTRVPYLPQGGETIASTDFWKNPGGKGANQAVAAAKLGGKVTMIGKVGKDEYGESLLDSLRLSGVSVEGIQQEGTTGMAFINVSSQAENNIVLVDGANSLLRISDIDSLKHMIAESDLIIMQLEISFEVIKHIIKIAHDLKKQVILNPAPSRKLPENILHKIHTLIPNEIELQGLTNMPVNTKEEILQAALHLKSLGVKRVIVTMGEKGSFLINDTEQIFIQPFPVKSIDSTGAGDSYIAAFAVGIMDGMCDKEAAIFASKVAAIAVTREGAQISMPTKKEVEEFKFVSN